MTALIMLMATAFPLIALWFANHYLGNETPDDFNEDHH